MALEISMSVSGDIVLTDGNYGIALPADNRGFAVLLSVIKARRDHQTKLATPGAPTQRMADEMLWKVVDDWRAKNLPGWNTELDL